MTAFRPVFTLPPRRVAAGAALALVAAASPAEPSPYQIGLSAGIARESNLLRLADGQPAPEGYQRSDTRRTTTLLAGLDQTFGRQRAYANLSVRDTRYTANPIYNNLGYTANTGVDWSTVGRVSGSLSASANRALYSFNTGYDAALIQQRNLQDTRSVNASLALGLVTQWSLYGNVEQLRVRNSLDDPTVRALDFDQDSARVGLRWQPSGAMAWNLGLGQTRGLYPKFQLLVDGTYAADRFTQDNLNLGLSLQPSGASVLELQLGRSSARYELNPARDFTGLTGSLAWNWQPGGRLRLSSRLSRETGQNSYATTVFGTPGTSDYSQVYDALRLQASYELSAKISLTASWQTVRRTVVQAIENPFIPLRSQGKDQTNSVSLGLRWTPLRSLVVGCDFESLQRRTSGSLATPLHNDSLACFGQFQLQL